jgi:hypothetical protein
MGIKLDHSVRLEKTDTFTYFFFKENIVGKSSGTSLHFTVPSVNMSVLITAPDPAGTLSEAGNRGSQPGESTKTSCLKLKVSTT